MAVKSRITTQGFKEYFERLSEAGKNVDVVADQALTAGADVILAGMKQRAPVDTGNLQDTLNRTEPQQDGFFHFIDVGLVDADGETARYGTVQEYGSSSNAAQPYIRPAMDEDIRNARKAMVDVFKRAGLEDAK